VTGIVVKYFHCSFLKIFLAAFIIVIIIFICPTDSQQWSSSLENGNAPGNVVRWYNFIKSLCHVDSFLASIPNKPKPKFGNSDKTAGRIGRKEEGKFVELPGAEEGKVVVRFPPEASG
jgi:hypothetical protein